MRAGAAARPAGGSLTVVTVPRTLHIPHTPHSSTTTLHNIAQHQPQHRTTTNSTSHNSSRTSNIISHKQFQHGISDICSFNITAHNCRQNRVSHNSRQQQSQHKTTNYMFHVTPQAAKPLTRAGTRHSTAPTRQQPGPSPPHRRCSEQLHGSAPAPAAAISSHFTSRQVDQGSFCICAV